MQQTTDNLATDVGPDLPSDLRRSLAGKPSTDLLWAAVIGAAAALLAYSFRMSAKGVQWLFTQHTDSLVATAKSLHWSVRLLVPCAGGLLAGLALYFGMRLHRGQRAKDYM